MSSFKAVNLNDAIYRMIHRKYDYLEGVTERHFSDALCPLRKEFKSNQVLTYKDWVLLLSGYPLPLYTDIKRTIHTSVGRCCAVNNNKTSNLKPWGITLGKFAGINGRPLCECKPLDEAFWYYDAVPRTMRGWNVYYNANRRHSMNEATVFGLYYENGWQFWLSEKGYSVGTGGTNALYTLQPGVYMAFANNFNEGNYSCIAFFNSNANWYTFLSQERIVDGNEHGTNGIFFVDSPITVHASWSQGTGPNPFQIGLYRITPPGYWHL